MLCRSLGFRPRSNVCQICELVAARRAPVSSRTFFLQNATRLGRTQPLSKPRRRLFTTSRSLAKPSESTLLRSDGGKQLDQELPELSRVMSSVRHVKEMFLAQEGIPTDKSTLAALRAHANAANIIMDNAVQQQLTNLETSSTTQASNLLSLDSNGAKEKEGMSPQRQSPLRLKQLVDEISAAAYDIIAHPNVFITPPLLAQYVTIQARLGKPETLPRVFSMFANKPVPRGSAGAIRHVKQNPDKMANAVEVDVAEAALDAAIEARDMDGAVGIIENSYATKAFVRSKVFKNGILPMAAFVGTPAAAYVLASRFSLLQDTMDEGTATGVAFAGIIAYVGFTAAIGAIAVSTANDQMKRVTWAVGTPLRQRWIREEQRAALDKVACSFGFSEQHRYGEEEGAEFQALREYIMRKGMVLDAVNLMEGMSD